MQKSCNFRQTLVAAMMLLLLFIARGASALRGATITDAPGDTFGPGPDILSIATSLSGVNQSTLEIAVSFAGPIQAASSFGLNSLGGYLVLDVNGDADLKAALEFLASGFPPTSGIDYYVDLFSEEFQPGVVNLLNSAAGFVATAPIAFANTQFTVRLPVSLLGSNSPRIGAVVGTFAGASDLAFQPAVTTVIPEPSSLVLFLSIGGLAACASRKRPSARR